MSIKPRILATFLAATAILGFAAPAALAAPDLPDVPIGNPQGHGDPEPSDCHPLVPSCEFANPTESPNPDPDPEPETPEEPEYEDEYEPEYEPEVDDEVDTPVVANPNFTG